MVRRGRDFDEDDVRVRANPRGSRPRTRQRPEHEDAADGMVIAVDRGRYTCLIGRDRRGTPREVTAMKARELGRKGVVVGDHVSLVGDLRGGPDSLARVVRVQPRKHVLRRTADDTDPEERVIVANADQLVIVTALAEPEPRPRMIDRCLVAAFEAGLTPILCLTKADLAPPGPLLEAYEPLGVTSIVTGLGGDLSELRRVLAGKVSVLVGHSGVGKSTLVNALVPDADRAIGQVNDVTGRGRHTSTSAVALRLPEYRIETPEPAIPQAAEGVTTAKPARKGKRKAPAKSAAGQDGWTQPILIDDQQLEELRERPVQEAPGQAQMQAQAHVKAQTHALPETETRAASQSSAVDEGTEPGESVEILDEGWVIDTPGVRSFGLAHVSANGVIAAFPDLAAVTAECPRGCTHLADAPDCKLDAWLAGELTTTTADAAPPSDASPSDEQGAGSEEAVDPTAFETAKPAAPLEPPGPGAVARVESVRRLLAAMSDRAGPDRF